MTREELKQYDGKDGRPAYIGYKGKVYDLSKSDFWTGGTHMGMFNAGEDLTDKIHMSPHGEQNIFRYPEVDVLTDDNASAEDSSECGCCCSNSTCEEKAEEEPKNPTETVLSDVNRKMIERQQWYKKYHPHPVMVHFPMGMFGLAFFAQILSIILKLAGNNSAASFLTATGIVSTAFAVLFIIPAFASGLISLSINYNNFPNKTLKMKMMLSGLVFVTGIVAVIIGKAELTSAGHMLGIGDALASFLKYNPLTSLYTLLTIINFAIVSGIGFLGGKITWPQDKK